METSLKVSKICKSTAALNAKQRLNKFFLLTLNSVTSLLLLQ